MSKTRALLAMFGLGAVLGSVTLSGCMQSGSGHSAAREGQAGRSHSSGDAARATGGNGGVAAEASEDDGGDDRADGNGTTLGRGARSGTGVAANDGALAVPRGDARAGSDAAVSFAPYRGDSAAAAGDAELGNESDGGAVTEEASSLSPSDVPCSLPHLVPHASMPTTTITSCTESAFEDAIETGGIVTFDCGDEVTLTLTSEKLITQDTVIDGGGKVTLSGGDSTRLLRIDADSRESTPVLTIRNLALEHGHVNGNLETGPGGAIYARGGSVQVLHSTFRNNSAAHTGNDVAGGAIYVRGLGSLTVVGSRFVGNRASNGGALGVLSAALTIVDSSFENNAATGTPGEGGNGGVIYMDGRGREAVICGSRFASNQAGDLGGAMFRTGYESEKNEISWSSFDGNYTADVLGAGASALYLQGVHVILSNSTIANGSSNGSAVRVFAHNGAQGIAEFTNVTIAGNKTYDSLVPRPVAAGVFIGSNVVGTLLNCTIANNTSQFGSGIWGGKALTVRNSIISNNADNLYTPLNCNQTASGQNNLQWPTGQAGEVDCTAGITRSDPLLAALADNGGPTQTMMLELDSPALGAGTQCPLIDQRGAPRDPNGCALGALEPAR